MKIREGFVSNSSSSSFVLAVGRVKDKDALDVFLEGVNIDYMTYEQAKKCKGFRVNGCGKEILTLDTYTGAFVGIQLEPDSLYFTVYESRELMEDEDGTIWNDDYTDGQMKIFALKDQTFVDFVDTVEDYGRNG